MKHYWSIVDRLWIIAGLVLAHTLLLSPDGSFLRLTGSLILLLLPGLAWADTLALFEDRLARWVVGIGLSYALLVIFGLLLFYVPGPVYTWMVLLVLDLLAASAILMRFWQKSASSTRLNSNHRNPRQAKIYLLVLAILLVGSFFRFGALGYSEFQGDETKPMVDAAEALEGREDALFTDRKKGPGEILIPMVEWRLTGTINELMARIPFALAGLLAILTVYLITSRMFGESAGLVAAGLMALNGFMVGFARIVQYQPVVIWMSLLALLSTWEWRQSTQLRWGVLTGAFLGVGLLFHYDALLITPALGYLLISKPGFIRTQFKSLAIAAFIVVATNLLFLGPFSSNPQATFTATYVSDRVVDSSSLLANNLFDFFHYTIFYNSFYYVLFTGLFLLGFLLWAVRNVFTVRWPGSRRYVAPALLGLGVLYLALYPEAFYISGLDLDLAFVPFVLLLMAAFLSPALNVGHKTVIVWLATTFLGYTFVVTDPRTHFYTISPAWVMLAAPAAVWLWARLASINLYLPAGTGLILTILFGGYLFIVFMRQDIEYRREWPESRSNLYWLPYAGAPRHQFGFVSNVGWKAVGGLYAAGQLDGRYETNSGSGIDRWYGRHQQVNWGCSCCQPKRYYLAFDYKEIDNAALADFHKIGQIILPANGRGVAVYSAETTDPELYPLTPDELSQAFDETARPAAFVAPLGHSYPVDIHLAGFFNLNGYELTAPSPHPGEEIAVTLFWQRAENYTPINFDVFVHLEDAEGNVWGQSNSGPVCGARPTSTWTEEETVADSHIIPLDPELPPGQYWLAAGMYLPAENVRLPVLDEEGRPIAESAKLGTVTIE